MVSESCIFFLEAQTAEEVQTILLPVGEPFEFGARLAEEFKFHLLKLPHPEDEVARSDLVSERLSHLRDTERYLFTRCPLNVLEIDKYTLRRFRPHIDLGLGVLGDALECLEHQVELSDAGEVALSAVRAFYCLVRDEALHVFPGPSVNDDLFIRLVLLVPVLDELVGSVACLAGSAVDQRIAESAYVSRRDPCLRIHQYSSVESDIESGFPDELLSPCVLDVVLELDPQRTEVPCVGKSSVDLRSREDVAPVLTESYDLLHGNGSVGNGYVFFIDWHLLKLLVLEFFFDDVFGIALLISVGSFFDKFLDRLACLLGKAVDRAHQLVESILVE